MPFRCVASSQAARNQVRSGRWLRCMTVPAVTEVSRRQALHCKVKTLRPSRQKRSWPHSGQAKPDPQRRCQQPLGAGRLAREPALELRQ